MWWTGSRTDVHTHNNHNIWRRFNSKKGVCIFSSVYFVFQKCVYVERRVNISKTIGPRSCWAFFLFALCSYVLFNAVQCCCIVISRFHSIIFFVVFTRIPSFTNTHFCLSTHRGLCCDLLCVSRGIFCSIVATTLQHNLYRFAIGYRVSLSWTHWLFVCWSDEHQAIQWWWSIKHWMRWPKSICSFCIAIRLCIYILYIFIQRLVATVHHAVAYRVNPQVLIGTHCTANLPAWNMRGAPSKLQTIVSAGKKCAACGLFMGSCCAFAQQIWIKLIEILQLETATVAGMRKSKKFISRNILWIKRKYRMKVRKTQMRIKKKHTIIPKSNQRETLCHCAIEHSTAHMKWKEQKKEDQIRWLALQIQLFISALRLWFFLWLLPYKQTNTLSYPIHPSILNPVCLHTNNIQRGKKPNENKKQVKQFETPMQRVCSSFGLLRHCIWPLFAVGLFFFFHFHSFSCCCCCPMWVSFLCAQHTVCQPIFVWYCGILLQLFASKQCLSAPNTHTRRI